MLVKDKLEGYPFKRFNVILFVFLFVYNINTIYKSIDPPNLYIEDAVELKN